MANQRLRASKTVSLPPADDFKRIRGIGPAIESRLHRAGIRTFARLAALSPDEVAALISGLSVERVAKQGWIRQARKLVPKHAQDKPHKKETAATVSRQHYANFTIEFLLSENDEARRTRMVHVQSGDMETWAGWEAERLIEFLARHTVARSQAAKSIPQVAATPKLVPPVMVATKSVPEVEATPELVQPVTTPAPAPSVTTAAEPVPQIGSTAQSVPPAPVAVNRTHPPSPQIGLGGVLRLLNLETVPTNTNKPQSILRYGQAFEVRLSLDLTDVAVTGNPPLDYMASIYAKTVGGRSNQAVGEAHGTIEFANRITLNAGVAALPRGLYRLKAAVTLMLASTTPSPRSDLKAWLEGGLFQVY